MSTLILGFAFSNNSTPLVRNDFDAGTPSEPAAKGSFQMVMVTFELAPADTETSPTPHTMAPAKARVTSVFAPIILRPLLCVRNITPPNKCRCSDNWNCVPTTCADHTC